MESKLKQKNIFESSFDSFEFDDGFLMKIDLELKKNKINKKQSNLSNKCNSKGEDNQRKKEKAVSDIKANYYDLPLFIEDLNESDFFDFSKNHKKKFSLKVNSHQSDEESKQVFNGFTSYLSPKQGSKASNLKLSSSTPLRPNDVSLPKEIPSTSQNLEKNLAINSEFNYLEADLFDDWDLDQINKKDPPKEKITFSQALKLIEEAESAKQSDQEGMNESLNLLTGEVVGADVRNMFEDSFDLPKSVEKKCEAKTLNHSVILIDESKTGYKPSAAQKLNFGSEKVNNFDVTPDKMCGLDNGFTSDDDFDFLTQELLKKPKIISKCKKSNPKSPNFNKSTKVTPLKGYDLNDSTDDVIIVKKKRAKCIKIIESDGTEDSPSPKLCRKSFTKKEENFQKLGREFIDAEAEVSDGVEISSDEAEEEGEYDKSFLDEDSYFSQNSSANMTAKYLESVKTVKRHGSFKIPLPKPYNPENIFSQVSEEGNTDYEIDSFCVPNDVEEEVKTDLSDLEIAEKILEMDRRKKKKKRTQKFRKLK